MSVYKLRPHHGMCLRYFRGEGYSQDFIKNMQEIINILATNPEIQLVSYNDSVCTTCPNKIDHKHCISDKKVLHYDKKVVELCDLNLDSYITWIEFSNKITECILKPNLRTTICGDCEWSHLCIDD